MKHLQCIQWVVAKQKKLLNCFNVAQIPSHNAIILVIATKYVKLYDDSLLKFAQ